MRGFALFLKARSVLVAMCVIVILGVTEKVLGRAGVVVSQGFDVNVPWSLILPMVTGVALATCTHTEFHQFEVAGARPLPAMRALVLVIMITVSIIVAIWSTSSLDGHYTTSAALRNTVGFTGIALVSASALGATTSWLPTVAFGTASVTVGFKVGVAQNWAWPVHGGDDIFSWAVSATLLLLGLTVGIVRGPRILSN